MVKAKLLADSYAWRLEAAVWIKTKSDGDETRCQPRLALVYRGWKHSESPDEYDILGYIQFGQDAMERGRSRWMVHYFPKNAETLWEAHDETAWSRRTTLSDGEKSEPRDSAEDAFHRLLEALSEDIPPLVQSALAKVGEEYLPVLKTLSRMYKTRFQPPVATEA